MLNRGGPTLNRIQLSCASQLLLSEKAQIRSEFPRQWPDRWVCNGDWGSTTSEMSLLKAKSSLSLTTCLRSWPARLGRMKLRQRCRSNINYFLAAAAGGYSSENKTSIELPIVRRGVRLNVAMENFIAHSIANLESVIVKRCRKRLANNGRSRICKIDSFCFSIATRMKNAVFWWYSFSSI